MKIKTFLKATPFAALWIILVIGSGGCATNKNEWHGPRIFSIGDGAVLTYETNQELSIPIEGMALANNMRYNVDVTVSGTASVGTNDYYFNAGDFRRPNLDVMKVTLTTNYLSRVKTGDSLDLAVHVFETDPARVTLVDIENFLSDTNDSPDSPEINRIFAEAKFVAALDGYKTNSVATNIYNTVNAYIHSNSIEQSVYAEAEMNLGALTEQNKNLENKLAASQLNLSIVNSNLNATRKSILPSLEHARKVAGDALKSIPKADTSDLMVSQIIEALEQLTNSGHMSYRDWPKSVFHTTDNETYISSFALERFFNPEQSDNIQSAISAGMDAEGKYSVDIPVLESKRSALEATNQMYQRQIEEIAGLITENTGLAQSVKQKHANEVVAELQNIEVDLLEFTDGGQVTTGHKVSTASRRFTFYETQNYREEVHNKRVLPYDIMAFPEPAEEAEKLFGDKIARHYFVVRLSIRNTDSKADKLVSTGMIRARGRAIVEANIKDHDSLRFTVPVEVAPHSAQQVYAVLTDENVKEPRAVVFRTLEFAGAIASAYTLTFGSEQAVKDAVQLATGVGIPAFGKFWPDRFPGYQRNIVNFAMEDLVKVPKGGVTSHKFLFFPKDKIEAIIIDQYSYGDSGFSVTGFGNNISDKVFGTLADPSRLTDEPIPREQRKLEQPDVFVAYLTFDDLDVPFENVFEPNAPSSREQAVDLLSDLATEVNNRQIIQSQWVPDAVTAYRLANALSKQQLKAATPGNIATVAATANDNWRGAGVASQVGTLAKANVLTTLTNIMSLVDLLQPSAVGSSDFLNTQLEDLNKVRPELEDMKTQILGGAAAEKYTARLGEISKQLDEDKAYSNFYKTAAQILGDSKVLSELTAISDPTKTMGPGEKADLDDINNRLSDLQTIRSGYEKQLLPGITFAK